MGDLVELRTLGVSSNRLESLPTAMGRLLLLEFLFANGNRLRSVPPELAALEHLKKVKKTALQHVATHIGVGSCGLLFFAGPFWYVSFVSHTRFLRKELSKTLQNCDGKVEFATIQSVVLTEADVFQFV